MFSTTVRLVAGIMVLQGVIACGSAVTDNSTTIPESHQQALTATNGHEEKDEKPAATPWLTVRGNHIMHNGSPWHGRGANIQDTRSCNACPQELSVAEVNRRIDVLVDDWHANFLRLTLESDGPTSSVLTDPAYVADLQAIVGHIGSKPNVYVEVSLWLDPTLSEQGWPTRASAAVWQKLTALFKDSPHVIFGLANEPRYNSDGNLDADVWETMNHTVAAIRAAERIDGVQQHVIAVQGTGSWARRLDYYMTHPITAGDGNNIAYEAHIYDPSQRHVEMIAQPAAVLPILVSEFGPVKDTGNMDTADCHDLMKLCEKLEVPYAAWTFHMRCPPNLLVDHSGGGCGIGMPLEPTEWGKTVRDRLHKRYGAD